MRLTSALLTVAASLLSAQGARAQAFLQNGTAFDPEISVINSGVIQDAQAVVSADRKYVTLNMRSTNTQLLALREFNFQTSAGGRSFGTVGMPQSATAKDAPKSNPKAPAPPVAPTAPAAPTVLDRPGLTRLRLAK